MLPYLPIEKAIDLAFLGLAFVSVEFGNLALRRFRWARNVSIPARSGEIDGLSGSDRTEAFERDGIVRKG